jgi:hypothetical protein
MCGRDFPTLVQRMYDKYNKPDYDHVSKARLMDEVSG